MKVSELEKTACTMNKKVKVLNDGGVWRSVSLKAMILSCQISLKKSFIQIRLSFSYESIIQI